MPICAECGVGYMDGESHACARRGKWFGGSGGVAQVERKSAVGAAQAPHALASRYRDGYRVAAFLVWFGAIVKTVGVVIGIIAVLGAISALSSGATQAGAIGLGSLGSLGSGGVLALGILLLGAVTALCVFAFGVMIGAQGQLVMATLDNAVNSSRFLTDEQRASILF